MLVTDLGRSSMVLPCGEVIEADTAHDALTLAQEHEYLVHVVLPGLMPRRAR